MRIPPIIERELRVQSRRRGTYWQRVLAAAAAISALSVALLTNFNASAFQIGARGPWLLAVMHTGTALFLAACCPLLCADTLARERREETLGILLLTPLGPRDIITGKLLAHLFHAFSLWLAIIPVVIIPLLLGGVSPPDIIFALTIEFGVILGSLAGGLIASSLTRQAGSAMAGAMILTLVFGEGLALVSFLGLLPTLIHHPKSDFAEHWVILATFGPWILGTGLLENGFSGQLGRGPSWLTTGLWTSLGSVFVASLGLILLAGWFAIARLRGLNRTRELTERSERFRRFWFQPRFRRRACRRREGRLRRNPVFWLYTNRPDSALRRWGWCALVAIGWTLFSLMKFDSDLALLPLGIPVLLALALGLVAASSFRRELEEGSFELLLVTPISPPAILRAKILAIWRDFFPAVCLATVLATLWSLEQGNFDPRLILMLCVWSSFLALPSVGSRLAVRRLSPVVAWGWTLGIAALLPLVFGFLTATLTQVDGEFDTSFWWRFLASFVPIQLAAAGFCGWCTATDLQTRRIQLKALP